MSKKPEDGKDGRALKQSGMQQNEENSGVELDLDEVERLERERLENEKRLDALCAPQAGDDDDIASLLEKIRLQREANEYMRREVESKRYDVGKVRSMNALDRKKLEDLEKKKKPWPRLIRNMLFTFAAGFLAGFIIFSIVNW
jgi:hypothetical protein